MLLIGKRKTKSNPSQVGGAIVLFEQLLQDLEKFEIEVEVIDTNYRNYKNKIASFLTINYNILAKGIKHNIIFLNGSNNILQLYGLPVFFFKFVFNKRIAIRFFGGDFHLYLNKIIYPFRNFIRILLRKADLVFFEQKYQVERFKSLNPNTHWFPNLRNISDELKNLRSSSPSYKGRFVFVGHIRDEKGINDILKVKQALKDDFFLHLYGMQVNFKCSEEFKTIFEEIYKGPLKPEEVVPKLAEYDVLVLPSYKEGYPGIIIEAFGVGMPVIATKLPGIIEMMDENMGVLIEPGEVDQLKNAVQIFNDINYKGYSMAAKKGYVQFDSQQRMPEIIRLLNFGEAK